VYKFLSKSEVSTEIPSSVIHLSSAPFIKKFYYKASEINYVGLKLRFAEPLPLCYAVFTYRKFYIINVRCLIVKFFINGALDMWIKPSYYPPLLDFVDKLFIESDVQFDGTLV
jgi:hypothetical protein